MDGEREFLDFAAGVLGVPAEKLTLETTYQSIPEWDSMAQLRIVTEVAAKFGAEIPFAEVVSVTSLWEIWRRINGASPKKVVAVDLDNTLWDGVVGEDGVGGLCPKTAFQRELKALKDRGILLVALSKNNFSDVEWLFGEGDLTARLGDAEGMVLSRDDFVSWKIGWNSKAENLAEVARELNLGVDAFVFVDDNPVERIEMAARLPGVAVAEFPPKLAAYFPPRELTEEDRHKTEEYRAETQRKKCLGQLRVEDVESVETVWKALGIRMDVHELKEDEVARVAQLSQKANQFNVCTNRYTEEQVRALGAEGLVVTAHAGDRFGDQGLIAYVIVKDGEILDFVMSCRVMGRGIEDRVMRETERLLRDRGVRRLKARWHDSGKNVPVRDLFDRLGFTRIAATAEERVYEKVLLDDSCSCVNAPVP